MLRAGRYSGSSLYDRTLAGWFLLRTYRVHFRCRRDRGELINNGSAFPAAAAREIYQSGGRMSLRNIPLWSGAFPTTFLLRQWTQRAPDNPLRMVPYLDKDRAANTALRAAWASAFPTRQPLPQGPLADAQGRGTDAFWDAFA